MRWLPSQAATVTAAAAVAALLAYVSFSIYDRSRILKRTPPIAFLGGSIDPNEVSSPSTVTVRRKVRWDFNCQRVVNDREIIDSERVVHKLEPDYISPPELAALPSDPAKPETYHIVNSEKWMMIPSHLPAGEARYRVNTCLTCGELSNEPICVQAPELSFTVR